MAEGVDMHTGFRRERLIKYKLQEQKRRIIETTLLGWIAQILAGDEGQNQVKEMLDKYRDTFAIGSGNIEKMVEQKKEILKQEEGKQYEVTDAPGG